jgi:hypothetical protein
MPSQTFTSNTSYAIPSDAANVTYIIHGGKGAAGGPCNTRVNRSSGGAGARGQKISGSLIGVAGSTLTLKMGNNGSGVGGNRDTGGNGGGGYWNGGRGGNNGSYDSESGWNAGGGGGGGGATAIRIGNTVLAGAGGGGGGACICYSGATDAPGLTSSDINTSGGSNGAAGQNSGAAWNGGGGGAGGGFPGGTTGTFAPGYAYNAGNDGSGHGGAGGAGFYNTSYHRSTSTLETSSSDSAFITISYEAQIVTSDSNWTTRSPQLDNFVGAQGSDPNNAWTTFLTNTNVGGQEPEGTSVTRSIEWKININNEGRQIFKTAVDDAADVYIDNVFQFSLNTYNANTSLTTADIISAGEHTIRIEHVNTGGPYGVAMDWTGYAPPVPPTVSLTTSDNTPIKGQSLTLTYSGSGFGITGYSFVQDIGGVVSTAVASPGGSGLYFPAASTTRTYTYSATNPYGTSSASQVITVQIIPPVVSLTSNATDDTIAIGDPVNLTWSASATGNDITNTTMTGVSSPGNSGTTTVSPSNTTTYTYSATNPSGTTSANREITVIQLPVVSLTSNDADNTIIKGQSVDLTWSAISSNPSGYNITDTSMTGVTTPGLSGTTTVTPGVTTPYTYTATNYAGTTSDTETITVQIIPPVVSLTSNASSDTITRPGSVQLTWSASATGNDITSTSLVDNNGNVIVTNPGTSGNVVVTPDYDTTYTYSATNPSGTTNANRPITVILPPPVVTLDIVDSNGNVLTDNTIIEGESLFLRWNTDGFDIVSTDLSNYSAIPGVSGTETFSPTIETEYVYSATNASGTDTTSITIIVYYPPVLTVSTSVEDAEGVSTIDLFDSVNIIWSTVGDGGTVTWTSGSPAITSTAGAGNETVTPLPASVPTETYCGIPSGLGGIGDEQCVTITVIPPPPEITEFFADPNPQNSLGGTPLYSTELNWDSDGYGDITGTITSDAGESFDVDAFGTLDITNLPQSDAPSTSPATRSYFLTLSNSGGSDTDNITVSSRNDNTPTNTWNTSFLNLEPSTTVTVVIGTISGVDMITEVSTSESVSFIGFSGAFSSTRSFSNGQAVQLKTVTMPFNTDTSGLPAGSEFGKTNTKTVVVETENGSINVTFTTKAPTIKEGFDLSSTINKYPYEDIDLIANLPTEFTTTGQIPMDQIEIDQEIKVDDPDAQISINNGEWQNVREI